MTYEFKITNFGINGWYIICLDGYIYKDCYLHSNFDMKKYIYPISKGYYSTYEKAESFLKKWAKKIVKK